MGQWGPSVSNNDKSAPGAYLTQAEVNALVQKAIAKSNKGSNKVTNKSSDTKSSNSETKCFKCGQTGHVKKDCTVKTNNWKQKAPKSGEPQTKIVDNKDWHWCAKCGSGGRWSPTHGTNDHKSDFTRNNTSTPAESNIHEGLYCSYTAESWSCEVQNESFSDPLWLFKLFFHWIYSFLSGSATAIYGILVFFSGIMVFLWLSPFEREYGTNMFRPSKARTRYHPWPPYLSGYPSSLMVLSSLMLVGRPSIMVRWKQLMRCMVLSALLLVGCSSIFVFPSRFRDASCFYSCDAPYFQSIFSMFSSSDTPKHEVLWDTGATLSVSHCSDDFVSPTKACETNRVMRGLAKGLQIDGPGEIDYVV